MPHFLEKSIPVIALALLAVGCVRAQPPPPPPPSQPTPAATEPAQIEVISVEDSEPDSTVSADVKVSFMELSRIQEFSEEIRALRDQIEVLEFNLQDARKRQLQLYDDLDARLRKIERASLEPVPNIPVPETPATIQEPEATPSNSDTSDSDEQITVSVVKEPVVEAIDPEAVSALYNDAFKDIKEGRYVDSIEKFQALIKDYPSSDLADDAVYWIAEANFVTKNTEEALQLLEFFVENYPQNRRTPDALLKTGVIYYEIGDYERARDYFTEVIDRYPASRVKFSAQRRLDKMNRDGLL